MESTWINHVKSPKLINLWHNEFNIISEMCSFILSWFSKVCDFEWDLFVFDFSYFVHLKDCKQLKKENTWEILEILHEQSSLNKA